MNTASHSIPTRIPAYAGVPLGRQRRYPAVSPFVRTHLALRRLAIEDADIKAQQHHNEVVMAFVEDVRRAVHASALS